jgi:hypothetical protein
MLSQTSQPKDRSAALREVMDREIAKIERAGRRASRNYAMSFARQFLRSPSKLNALSWNLSQAEPEAGIREVRRIARQDGDTIQLCGAMIAFRWARRHERAQAGYFLQAAE